VSGLQEFELHFETRQEYIKAGNEKRMADERREQELKAAEQNNQSSSGNIANPLQTFKDSQKEILNEQTTSSSLAQSKETAIFLKPEQTNQKRQNLNSNAMANQQRTQTKS